jgi:hypothetical protein
MSFKHFLKKYLVSFIIAITGGLIVVFGFSVSMSGVFIQNQSLAQYTMPIRLGIIVLGDGVLLYSRYYFRNERRGTY